MYKKDYLKIIIAILFTLFWCIVFDIKISSTISAAILTVISIIFGFTITTIATLTGSSFSKVINDKIDNDTKLQQTQLQTLRKYFLVNTKFSLGIIIIVMVNEIFIVNMIDQSSTFLIVHKILSFVTLSFVSTVIFVSWRIYKVLIKNLILEAGKKDK